MKLGDTPQQMRAIIDNFFVSKKRYWYVLAINENIDQSFPIQEKTKCIVCDRNLKIVLSVADSLKNVDPGKKGEMDFIVIKTAQYVHPSGVVPTEQMAHMLSSRSENWGFLKFYLRGTLKMDAISAMNFDLIEDFARNNSK